MKVAGVEVAVEAVVAETVEEMVAAVGVGSVELLHHLAIAIPILTETTIMVEVANGLVAKHRHQDSKTTITATIEMEAEMVAMATMFHSMMGRSPLCRSPTMDGNQGKIHLPLLLLKRRSSRFSIK